MLVGISSMLRQDDAAFIGNEKIKKGLTMHPSK